MSRVDQALKRAGDQFSVDLPSPPAERTAPQTSAARGRNRFEPQQLRPNLSGVNANGPAIAAPELAGAQQPFDPAIPSALTALTDYRLVTAPAAWRLGVERFETLATVLQDIQER